MKIDDSRGGGELKIEELTYDKARITMSMINTTLELRHYIHMKTRV